MLLELVKRLISFKSISPADDSSIIFLKSYLDNLGFYTKIIKSSGISNLFACTNDNQNVDICFAGHIDVVPHGDLSNWHYDPFSAEIVDDIIYGRGIVDMKAAIACFIVAVQEYLNKKNSNINIGIIITSDEELDSQNGMIPVIDYLNENNYKIKNCIVGEPTCKEYIGDTIKIGRRGSINFKVELYGKSGHVAYPENIKNPIKYMLEALQKLINYEFDDGNEYFPPSHCEITNIKIDNEFSNVTPEKVEAYFNIRFNNLHNIDSLKEKIKYIFNVGCEFKITHNVNPALPFITNNIDLAEEFSKSVYNKIGKKPKFSTDGGTSDARFLNNITNVIEFGLLNQTAHQANECCHIHDLVKLKEIYHTFLCVL